MTQQPMARTGRDRAPHVSGYIGLGIGLVLLAAAVFFVLNVGVAGPQAIAIAAPLFILGAFVLSGLYMLQPNEAAILLLFGAYKGTDRPRACAGPTRSTRSRRSACARTTSPATG